MAKYGSPDVALFAVNGADIKGVLTEITTKTMPVTEESHGFGVVWPEHTAVGIKQYELRQSGFFDDAANSENEALNEQQGLAKIVVLAPVGNAIGRPFIGFAGPLVAEYERIATRNALHKANAVYRGSGQVDEGLILQELEAKTSDWNTEGAESVDAGALSSDGGAGYLVVTAFSGFSGFIAKIRHSADDVTYADLITFDDVTAGPTAQRKTVAGTVNQHLAVDGDVTGAGSVTALIGFARG
jgi:hypothetical protein